MNRLDKIGVTRERLEGGGFIGLQYVTDVGLLSLQIGALQPGQRILEGTPEPRRDGMVSGSARTVLLSTTWMDIA